VTITPYLIAVVLIVGLLVLLPARLLNQAGLPPRAIGTYTLLVWFGALVIATRVGPTAILVPLILVAYLAPFVIGPERLARLAGRDGRDGARPIRNVTPPQDRPDDRPDDRLDDPRR
jgi:hypothetical protein